MYKQHITSLALKLSMIRDEIAHVNFALRYALPITNRPWPVYSGGPDWDKKGLQIAFGNRFAMVNTAMLN